MRHPLLSGLILAGALAGAPTVAAQDEQLPAGVRGVRASQVVERVLDLRADLGLSEQQVSRLAALRARYRAEPGRFTAMGPRSMLHPTGVRITLARDAYRSAIAVLTPAQRGQAFRLLDQPRSRRPRLAARPESDPLAHHTAVVEAPRVTGEYRTRPDPLMHQHLSEPPTQAAPSGRRERPNPITHRE